MSCLISGEAGIGKSSVALTAEFLEIDCRANRNNAAALFLLAPGTPTALYPIIGHIELAANSAREDDAKTRLDKLEVEVAGDKPLAATIRQDIAARF